MSEEDFVCQFDPDWKSQCQLDITKIGTVNIMSRLDFCSEPPLLNIVLKIQRHAWKMSFLQGNSRESRLVGLEYFPLRLHVDFQKMSSMTYHVECCLEALKTSGTTCYLNSTLLQNAEKCSNDNQTSNGSLVVFCLLLLVSLFAVVTVIIVVYKRMRTLRILANRRRPFIVPKLPRAKGYDVFDDRQSSNEWKKAHEHVPIVISSIPEETNEQLNKEIGENWRESKFVQTSCNSLDTEILILSSSNSSQNSSGDGGGRNSREPLAESPL